MVLRFVAELVVPLSSVLLVLAGSNSEETAKRLLKFAETPAPGKLEQRPRAFAAMRPRAALSRGSKSKRAPRRAGATRTKRKDLYQVPNSRESSRRFGHPRESGLVEGKHAADRRRSSRGAALALPSAGIVTPTHAGRTSTTT